LAKALFHTVNFFAVCISATDRWAGIRLAARVGQSIVNRRETWFALSMRTRWYDKPRRSHHRATRKLRTKPLSSAKTKKRQEARGRELPRASMTLLLDAIRPGF